MKIEIEKTKTELTKADFVSDQMVKWCPGCGNHAILAAVANIFPQLGYQKEKIVVVSGIGCSSRFPYYVNTYGFHGIHGRANAIATGIKITNPHLSVWVDTGDGDSTAIGGNHFIHIIRRNLDVNILLFNNQIYGLTKGQYSPTSPMGAITKTSPFGTIEQPFNPGELVLGAQGTFFARVPDNNLKLMQEVMLEAAQHDGTSVIEILENCVIFNDKAHAKITSKESKDDAQLILQHGKPMLFGKDNSKGIILKNDKLRVVTVGENGFHLEDILVHDKYAQDLSMHLLLSKMAIPKLPMAMGVIRSVKRDTFNELFEDQMLNAQTNSKIKYVDDLLNSGDTWEM
ncbi:MAG: 2-oxoacid:ferredoxin oxidoreductase subunit beta [Bacteroidales bacterium]|jgi:2-oxoglutarate ferredoxin oxidoreductase subunit beta|nr:2-oxoacid:ferredoxin oxidoreductase subunit beta [Bacteroidales bacterium]